MPDFKDKQIEKLQAAISKLEGKSGDAQRAVREKFVAKIATLESDCEAGCKAAASKFQAQIDVLEKQLKALGGGR